MATDRAIAFGVDELLAAIPEIARVERADLKSTDVLVLTVSENLTQLQVANLNIYLKTLWPANRVLILGSGMSLQVVRSEDLRPDLQDIQ